MLNDLKPWPAYLGIWILNFTASFAVESRSLFRSLFTRHSQTILEAALDWLWTLVRYNVQVILTTAALFLNAVEGFLNRVLRMGTKRGLNEKEIAYLKPIFGDSVDYYAISILSNGIKEKLRISPQAVCNGVFLRQHWWGGAIFMADGSLTERGYKLLGHEVGHVWQFQTGGAGYIGDALLTQLFITIGKKTNHRFSDGYNLKAALKSGRNFDRCNVEQQGVMAEMIGETYQRHGSLTCQHFNATTGYQLSEQQFQLVLEGHQVLNRSAFRTCLQGI